MCVCVCVMDTCDSCCTRSLLSTVWSSIATIVVYTEEVWGWSMDRSQIKDDHPHLYKFVKGCNRMLNWGSSSKNQDDDVELPKCLDYVLRGISTTFDFLLQSAFLQVIDYDNLETEAY